MRRVGIVVIDISRMFYAPEVNMRASRESVECANYLEFSRGGNQQTLAIRMAMEANVQITDTLGRKDW